MSATFAGWTAVLTSLSDGQDLEPAQARGALAEILAGNATPAQIAAFIVALRIKGESVGEVAAMVDAMLDAAEPLSLPPGTIDIVGTGGSPRRRTKALNVSTMACIVAAGAGAVVCKHGNVRASSTSGSMDVLRALDIGFDFDGTRLASVVAEAGIGFCFAKAFHPAMRHAGPVRAELGVPTVFNVLGPLSHPGRVDRQVIGVGDARLIDLVAGTVAARGAVHTLVVHGHGALDEIALTGRTQFREVRDGEIVASGEVDPAALGCAVVAEDAMPGGTPEDNAVIARDMFDGARGPARDIVVMNAGAGLVVSGHAPDLASGADLARAALDDGRAAATLERVARCTA